MRASLLPSLLAASLAGCAPDPAAPSIAAEPGTCDPDAEAPNAFERSRAGVPEVDPTWLAEHHCGVRVVDVREASELAAARLPFAEHVPLGRVADEAATWDPDAPIVLVCRSGRRSARAARTLEEMGFSRVASMTGGLLLWESAGLPVARGATPASATPQPERPTSVQGARGRTDIEEHLGDPERIRWVKAAALLMQGTQSCVDGRAMRPVIGTPGGDAGELLLALAALEQARGEELGHTEIGRVLDAYLEAFGRFYVHTDEHALSGLRDDPRFAPHVSRLGLEGFVRRPPRALEPALREALTDPERVGCGHLRLILQHPDEYGVRRELARELLAAVLTRLWQGEAIDFVILEGEHEEDAVVNVRLDREVHPFTRIPTVVPRIGEHELFVNHPEVSAWLREQNATFLFEVDPWLRAHPERREAFLDALEELGGRQLHATLEHLAQSLPVYEAHVGRDGVRVEGPLR